MTYFPIPAPADETDTVFCYTDRPPPISENRLPRQASQRAHLVTRPRLAARPGDQCLHRRSTFHPMTMAHHSLSSPLSPSSPILSVSFVTVGGH